MSERPNLLVIHTDQQSCWSIGSYGGALVETPHIDSLAEEGAILRQFFTNVAVCTPSRGCFLTGRFEHHHGAYQNNLPLNRDEITFAQVLKDNGYDTGYAGKWHLDGRPRPGWVHPERSMGFDDARFMFNRGHWKTIEDSPMNDMEPVVKHYREIGDEQTYTTDWLTEKAIDFVTEERENPFCYMLSIPDPHTPFTVRAPYDSMYKAADMPLPSTLYQENVPDWALPRQAPDEDKLRQHMANYCGMVKLIDDCVGRLVASLREKGILDETVIVFTSDHGEYMGEHGLMNKNQLYETAYRVPMIIRYPEQIRAGTEVHRIVDTVDVQPTILRLMGVEPCGREDGRDASPLLRGETVDWEDVCYIHHASNRAGLFTDEYELAYVKDRDAILFDRKNDPDQVHNLFGQDSHVGVVVDLTLKLSAHHEAVHSPAAEWLIDLRL